MRVYTQEAITGFETQATAYRNNLSNPATREYALVYASYLERKARGEKSKKPSAPPTVAQGEAAGVRFALNTMYSSCFGPPRSPRGTGKHTPLRAA
jgi:hypothetical protein